MSQREALGWFSSLVLLATLGKQLHKQWQEKSSRGVSKWLFIGQLVAEIGFITYSWLVSNWVFFVTNMLLLLENVAGLLLVLHYRRLEQEASKARTPHSDSQAI